MTSETVFLIREASLRDYEAYSVRHSIYATAGVLETNPHAQMGMSGAILMRCEMALELYFG